MMVSIRGLGNYARTSPSKAILTGDVPKKKIGSRVATIVRKHQLHSGKQTWLEIPNISKKVTHLQQTRKSGWVSCQPSSFSRN